jgi:prophage regulatory protein
LSVRTDLLESTAQPPQAPSPSSEQERRDSQRRAAANDVRNNWRAHVPGGDKSGELTPPAIAGPPYELPPPARGPPLPRFLRRKQVLDATSLSNSEMYSLMKDGRFPKPLKLTGTTHTGAKAGVVVWVEAEIIAWMESRIAARDAE